MIRKHFCLDPALMPRVAAFGQKQTYVIPDEDDAPKEMTAFEGHVEE